jgi:hypothetical protein
VTAISALKPNTIPLRFRTIFRPEGERRFRMKGDQLLSLKRNGVRLGANCFPLANSRRCSDAGQSPGIETPSIKEDRVSARRKSIRKIKEALRLRFELGAGVAPDRAQLRNGAGYGPRLFGAGGCGRDWLAVIGRLGEEELADPTIEKWHPRQFVVQRSSHRNARRVHAQETQSVTGRKQGMIAGLQPGQFVSGGWTRRNGVRSQR